MLRLVPIALLVSVCACAPTPGPTTAAESSAGAGEAGEAGPAAAPIEIEEQPGAQPERAPGELVVHEWGTFTARLDARGNLRTWTEDDRVEPLPKFVFESWMTPAKQAAEGTVRMETPVLYFYVDAPRELAVEVGFPGGFLTEWYPSAKHEDTAELASLTWAKVALMPGPDPSFPVEGDSHYYAARQTDAAPLEVVNADGGIEHEKMLFYRGVGSFALPLDARQSKAGLELSSTSPIQGAVVVRREGEALGFARVDELNGVVQVAVPDLDGDLDGLHAVMQELLEAEGLYPREAAAMIETWKALWFEDGLRVLYMVPRELTDATLPLKIEPAPDQLVRVLVGRLDLG